MPGLGRWPASAREPAAFAHSGTGKTRR
jgi:hypothetical protein